MYKSINGQAIKQFVATDKHGHEVFVTVLARSIYRRGKAKDIRWVQVEAGAGLETYQFSGENLRAAELRAAELAVTLTLPADTRGVAYTGNGAVITSAKNKGGWFYRLYRNGALETEVVASKNWRAEFKDLKAQVGA